MSEQDDAARRLEPGRWRGEYLDAFGHRGRIELAVEEREGELRGTYELTFRTEDAPQKVAGEFRGRVEEGRVAFEVPLEAQRERQAQAEPARFEARLSPAGSFARQAMIGMTTEVRAQNFGGGVWIAWRFEDARG